MSADLAFLKSLEEEHARLYAELQASPAYVRLCAIGEAISKLKSAYGIIAQASNGQTSASPVTQTVTSTPTKARGGVTALTAQLAKKYMLETGRRLRSGEIVALLARNGIQAPGKKPQAGIASVMSHHPDFDNANDERGVGYGLKAWSETKQKVEPAPPSREAPVYS